MNSILIYFHCASNVMGNLLRLRYWKTILLSYLFKSLDHYFRHFYNIVITLSVIIQYTVIAETHKNRVFEMYAIIVII